MRDTLVFSLLDGEDIVRVHMKVCIYYIIWIFISEVGKSNKTSEPSLDSADSSSSYDSSKKLLGGYLAGLIEGDGSIIVPKTIRNQKGKYGVLFGLIFFTKKRQDL